jgi:hypothetical protein
MPARPHPLAPAADQCSRGVALTLVALALAGAACDSGEATGPGASVHEPPPGPLPSCVAGPVVRVGGSGADHATIAAALEAAPANARIRVGPGPWPAVRIERDDVALCGVGNDVVIDSDDSFGIYVGGANVVVEGFRVMGVVREAPGRDHGPSGIVVAGRDVRLRHIETARNGVNGILVTDAAAGVLLEDVTAYDNTWAGIALGGGREIRIVRADLHNTGRADDPEGRRQRYGILTDNVGDTRSEGGSVVDVDGIGHIEGVRIEDSTIRGHLAYGIRISAGNERESALESGRITTRNVALVGSHIHDNGADTDDWVGGLYHHGNILLQHVEGGLVEGNRVEGGWTWGLDAYACNGVVYRDNIFVNNDRGLETPGVTIAPTGVEINGGRDNVFANNLVYGNGTGVFSSWIPDSGDGFDRPADAFDSFDGTFSLQVERNLIVGNAASFTEPGGEPEILVDYMEIGPERFARGYVGNVIGTIPDWYFNGDVTALSPSFTTDNPHWNVPASAIFVDAPGGDFRIRPDSPVAGAGIGPASIQP